MKLDSGLTPNTKVNWKWIKYLNVSNETIKLVGDNKSKNEPMGLHHAKNLLYSKGQHQHNKKASYSMGEYIHK